MLALKNGQSVRKEEPKSLLGPDMSVYGDRLKNIENTEMLRRAQTNEASKLSHEEKQ